MATRKNRFKRMRKKGGTNTKWAIVQYDNRPLNSIDIELMERNKYYAKKWGHDYILRTEGYDDIPTHWRKVLLVKDILNTDKYRGVLWLDTDAVVYKMDTNINDLVEDGKHMYVSADVLLPIGKGFCAGVWFVLNTPIGKEIMTKWSEKYDRNAWRKNNTSWRTDGEWAGINYEQGSFSAHIQPHYNDSIKYYDTDFLQALSPSDKTYIMHFYFTKDKRQHFIDTNPLDKTIIKGGYTRRKKRKRVTLKSHCR